MSNNKQSSVDIFKEKLIDIFEDYHDGIITLDEYIESINKATQQAKEMEKNQIINAHEQGQSDEKDYWNIGDKVGVRFTIKSKQYYNETYGGNI
jgi:hypothetical protein